MMWVSASIFCGVGLKEIKRNKSDINIRQEASLLSFWPPGELSSYRPLGILGYGGRSTIVEARDRLGKVVAVKLPFKKQNDVPNYVLRKVLAREGKVLASISHQSVVRIIEADVSGSYIVLERLLEQSLFSKYRANTPPIRIALGYLIKLAEALEAIHYAGFLHLDLKPQNVLFHDLATKHPVIVDFGSARSVNKPIGPGTIDLTKLGSGKYLFKAPEQLMVLEERFGTQTDFFALGVMLYWFLCGTLPFSNNCISTVTALASYQYEYGKAIAYFKSKQFPLILANLLDRLLKISMSERPASAKEITGILRCSAEYDFPK